MISKVKATEAYVIQNPITISKNYTIKQVQELVEIHNIKTFLVTDELPSNQMDEMLSPSRAKGRKYSE